MVLVVSLVEDWTENLWTWWIQEVDKRDKGNYLDESFLSEVSAQLRQVCKSKAVECSLLLSTNVTQWCWFLLPFGLLIHVQSSGNLGILSGPNLIWGYVWNCRQMRMQISQALWLFCRKCSNSMLLGCFQNAAMLLKVCVLLSSFIANMKHSSWCFEQHYNPHA